MSQTIAQIFAFLFSEGFGELDDPADGASGACQDATGTGMGEGEGANDVSSQIDDEDQLLGTSEKVMCRAALQPEEIICRTLLSLP